MSYTDLASAVKTLWSHYGRNLTRDGQESWVRLLKEHDGPRLREVFRSWTQTETSLPTTAGILARLHGRTMHGPPVFQQPTPEQRKRSEHSAIMSMLWLHYVKGWALNSFAGTVVGNAFGCDPQRALEAAAKEYDKAAVERYIEQLEASEPPSQSKTYTDRIRQPQANQTRGSWSDLDDIPDIG